MNKIYISSLLLLSAISYSQKKIEPGTYLSTSEGQNIKLRLSTDKKFEIVLFHGDYEIKNDTLKLGGSVSESASDFDVNFTAEANPSPGKVKVQLFGKNASLYSSSIYIGTQNGKATPVFKNLSEFSTETNYNEDELNFEVDRAEFFYLVKEDYYSETTVEKYILPKDKNEIKFEYTPNYFGKMRLEGYYNEKDELVISENKKSPLLFLEESKISKLPKITEKPIETKKQKNWTYTGKQDSLDPYTAVDSTYTPSNFKLILQDNLKKALEATKKTPQKFLVISYDPDNKMGNSEFDEFIKNQQYSIGSYISYETASKEYDRYNFYNASAKDKSWALKNKITDIPSTIVVDSDGTILSQTKGNLASNQYLFDVYYSSIHENLKQVKAIRELNNLINSKAKEKEVLQKMVVLADRTSDYSLYPPLAPPVVEATPASEMKVDVEVNEAIQEVAVDTAMAYTDYYNQNETVYNKINFDKKKLLATWDKIVKIHEKDSKPDMDFVKVSLSEIQNKGFYNKIYSEQRLFDETNFKAIDYLVKHYDAVLMAQNAKKEADTLGLDYDYQGTIDYSLPSAITENGYLITPETPADYQKRILGIYKKLMEKQSDNASMTTTYFNTLETLARNSNTEGEYVSEYDSFFNKAFKGTNEIEILNDLYSAKAQNGLNYLDWSGFKNSFSNASNQAAWFVVEKSTDPESIKKAIKWSESSLRIEKNNPYYLDTLAQLYYKNGEKPKAIATQEQAVKYADDIDGATNEDLKTVLQKMKNGTY